MWDTAEEVARYETWYTSPRGSFALAEEQRLIASLVSAWPRRGHTLLEIGCGPGHFLELFHGAGFDVTGLDNSQPMLDAAKARMEGRATLRYGQAEHMPFDDDEFDFAAMISSLECMEEPDGALAEAFRVASRGVIIVFLNSWSLYWLEQQARARIGALGTLGALIPWRTAPPPEATQSTLSRVHWYNLAAMVKKIYAISGKRPQCFRSVLFSPSRFWKKRGNSCPNKLSFLPFGAVVGLRVDLSPVCVTPIAAHSRKVLSVPQ